MLLEIAAVAVPMLVGAAALFFKKKFADHARAITSIEAGVLHAWEEFGKDRKSDLRAEAEDTKFPRKSAKFEKEDISKLKDMAKAKAVEVMSSLASGKSLGDVLDPAVWDLEIKKAISRAKAG
jgi:hypothetical protein